MVVEQKYFEWLSFGNITFWHKGKNMLSSLIVYLILKNVLAQFKDGLSLEYIFCVFFLFIDFGPNICMYSYKNNWQPYIHN